MKEKSIGKFQIGPEIIQLCTACLDNASRLISKEADRIFWNRDLNKLENIYVEDIKAWEKLYPNVDVIKVVDKDIPEWIMKKIRTKKAIKSDYRKTIMNWLKKQQIKAVGL
jgi:hypothetical protein